jgi:hypothetical protein
MVTSLTETCEYQVFATLGCGVLSYPSYVRERRPLLLASN